MTKKRSLNFWFFLAVFLFDLIFISLAIFYYPEKFPIDYPFSYASMARSYTFGLINSTSRYLYATGMIISGFLMLALTIWRILKKETRFETGLIFLAASGFFVAGFSPDDIRHETHVFGSALFVGAFWFLATINIYSLRKNLPAGKYWLLQSFLQIPIFAYAGTYFANWGIVPNILQKPAFLALVLILLWSSWQTTRQK